MDVKAKKVFSALLCAFVGILLLCAVFLIFPVHRKYQKMESKAAALNEELAAKNAECIRLNKLVSDLESNPRAVEKVAREKFGLCKDGELVLKYK
jgi:cell division protein FtsB